MWGGIYAIMFSFASIFSTEKPIENGFPETKTQRFHKYSYSKVEFQDNLVGDEIQYHYYTDRKFGPVQYGYSLSVTDQGGMWVGSGFIRRVNLIDNLNLNFDLFPGIYIKNSEEDLGGWLMFRSGIELEYSLSSDWRISIGYDHRSSGDIWKYNPGMETIKLGFSKSIL